MRTHSEVELMFNSLINGYEEYRALGYSPEHARKKIVRGYDDIIKWLYNDE